MNKEAEREVECVCEKQIKDYGDEGKIRRLEKHERNKIIYVKTEVCKSRIK